MCAVIEAIIAVKENFKADYIIDILQGKETCLLYTSTHDMNSVLGIGEKVIYIYEGHKEWEGTKDDIFTSTNERLNNFIFEMCIRDRS